MSARKRNRVRKNTRRARGRRTNRERPTAPYRDGAAASVRVISLTGESARRYTYAITREAGFQRRLRFRADTAGIQAPAEPGNGLARAPGPGPARAERGES